MPKNTIQANINKLDDYSKFVVKTYRSLIDRFKLQVVNALTEVDLTNLLDVSTVLTSFDTLLVQAGLNDFREEFSKYSERVILSTAGEFSDTKITSELLKALDTDTLKGIHTFNTQILDQFVTGKAKNDLAQSLMFNVLSNKSKKEIVNDLTNLDIGLSEPQIETTVNSALGRLMDTVRLEKAVENNLEYGVYVGVLDELTRPFCEAVLTGESDYKPAFFFEGDPYYDLDTAARITNDPDRLYNCRHHIAYVKDPRN